MTDLASKHKTYRLLGPFRSEIYTSDPVNVEYINLKSNFDNYGKGWYNYDILRDLLGDGIFAVDGQKWRQQRKISSHEFSTRMLRDFSSRIFQKVAAKLAYQWSEVASSNQTVEIQHPSVQDRISQEVDQVTGMKRITNFSEFASSLSEDILEKMHYLHAAITETLRIYPAVPVDGKMCLSDDTLPDGFSVMKGSLVAYQPYAMGRMKSLWGDDAEQFKPERWLDENGVFRPESPFKFTAFQAGPRICLGKEFAYRQMKIVSAVLMACFVFKMSDANTTVTYRKMINLHMDGGLEVRVFQRYSRSVTYFAAVYSIY